MIFTISVALSEISSLSLFCSIISFSFLFLIFLFSFPFSFPISSFPFSSSFFLFDLEGTSGLGRLNSLSVSGSLLSSVSGFFSNLSSWSSYFNSSLSSAKGYSHLWIFPLSSFSSLFPSSFLFFPSSSFLFFSPSSIKLFFPSSIKLFFPSSIKLFFFSSVLKFLTYLTFLQSKYKAPKKIKNNDEAINKPIFIFFQLAFKKHFSTKIFGAITVLLNFLLGSFFVKITYS